MVSDIIKPKTNMVNNAEQHYTSFHEIKPILTINEVILSDETNISDYELTTSKDVERKAVEVKKVNPLSRFIKKLDRYVDKVENFLQQYSNNEFKNINDKKILFESEKSRQKLYKYQAKSLLKKVREKEETEEKESVNLVDNPDLGAKLASLLGLSAVAAGGIIPPGGTEIYKEVVGEGEFAIQETATQAPAWIPFPKGTAGLVFTSGYKWRWGRQHKGIDIASASEGKPVITPITGVITEAGFDSGGYGYKVVVKSGQVQMLFGHLMNQPPVRSGQNVVAGTVIGYLGNTGRSTGPHLHWEVIVNGSHVDPSAWTRSNPPSTSTAGANSNLNAPPQEPPNHPSRGDFDGKVKNNESEGGINFTRKIMVGEAGKEFVIPISQMSLFAQGMIEEKIKSLTMMDYMQNIKHPNIGFVTENGQSQETFASGAVVIPFNQNHYTSAKKLKSLFPQAKDYHIAAAMGNFETESTGMYPNRYQGDYSTPPTWKKPGSGPGRGIAQWEVDHAGNNYNGRWSQGIKKFGPSLFTNITKQLDFVKWELDSNTRYLPFGNATKKHWLESKDLVSATKNFLEGYEAPSIPHMEQRIARAFSFNRNMKKLLSVPSKPTVKKEDKNIFQKVWDSITSPKKTTASLNDIDQTTQMEVAKSYRDKFSFEGTTNEIIAFYKPTVYYSEEA